MKKSRAPCDVDLVVYLDCEAVDVSNLNRHVRVASSSNQRLDGAPQDKQILNYLYEINRAIPSKLNSDLHVFLRTHSDSDHITVAEFKGLVQGSCRARSRFLTTACVR